MKSKVYLIGAGPGKPDLITLRGVNILKEADVVIYDYLVDKQLLGHAKEGSELICCDRSATGEKIGGLMVKKSSEGKKVARLKNGDVAIFSRLSQELDSLVKNKINFELVPGVTAASGAASYAGIPLTDRKFSSTCAFVTGQEDPEKEMSGIDWKALSKMGTLVFYMAVENLSNIVEELIKAGKPKGTACVIIQNATLYAQRFLSGTLGDIVYKAKRENIRPPAVVIVGEAVKFEKRFNWLRKDKKVIFTGLSKERFFIKGEYFHLPMIKIKPMDDYREFDRCLKNIRVYDWIVFVSRYGAEYFFNRLVAVGLDTRALSGIRIAAVGDSTKKRLLDFGVKADLTAKIESAKGLIKEFEKINIKDKKIFLPRSDISDKGLEDELIRLGAMVTASFAYKNILPDALPDLDLKNFQEIIFSSPSTVRNFKKRYKRVPRGIKIRHIGAVTLQEIKRCFPG